MLLSLFFFFFNDTATTEIYTLSLHDALPISAPRSPAWASTSTSTTSGPANRRAASRTARDRKSTRLNSSHSQISYAVFCLKKKKKKKNIYKIIQDKYSICTVKTVTQYRLREE